MIVIVDYGMGNLGSIANMLSRIGVASTISADPVAVRAAERLILPGVGSFDKGMSNLAERGLDTILRDKVLHEQTPILGICLGMQLFARGSEEGVLPGLGWIQAEAVRFTFTPPLSQLAVPHMGWSEVRIVRPDAIFAGYDEPPRFYFVHSFHVRCERTDDVLATCNYGVDFTASLSRANIVGTQFHPEKSHKWGLRLLKNFAEWRP